MKKTTLGTLAIIACNTIFGFSFLFSKVALSITTPFVLLSIRFITAFLVLNLLVLTGKVRISLKGKPVKLLLLLGLFQPVIYFVCENYGISMTTASFAGVLLGAFPVVGLVFGRIFLKETVTRLQFVCSLISVVGVAMTTTGGGGTFSPLGAVLLVCAMLSGAFFNVLSRGISDRFSAFERTYVMFAFGSVVFTVIALFQNKGDVSALLLPLSNPRFWIPLLYLAVLSSVCAFMLANYGLNYVSVSKSALYSNFTTVVSVLAGILIMKDAFTPLQLVGVVIIIVSVFGVSYQKEPAEEHQPSVGE